MIIAIPLTTLSLVLLAIRLYTSMKLAKTRIARRSQQRADSNARRVAQGLPVLFR